MPINPLLNEREHTNRCTNTLCTYTTELKQNRKASTNWVELLPRRPTHPHRLSHPFAHTHLNWHQPQSSRLIKSCLPNHCVVAGCRRRFNTCCSGSFLITANFHIHFHCVHNFHSAHTYLIYVNNT